MRQPIDGKILVAALRQMADFTTRCVLSASEKQVDLTVKLAETVTKGREAGFGQLLESTKLTHESIMQGLERITRLASATADSFEALDRRLRALEAELELLRTRGETLQ
jgi:hypothetical protein